MSAILLLYYYTSRNSWHCDKTAVISSVSRRSFSIRSNFLGPLSPFYAAPTPLASGVAQNRFQEHNHLYEVCKWPVKNFRGLTWLQASTGYRMPKVQTLDT